MAVRTKGQLNITFLIFVVFTFRFHQCHIFDSLNLECTRTMATLHTRVCTDLECMEFHMYKNTISN